MEEEKRMQLGLIERNLENSPVERALGVLGRARAARTEIEPLVDELVARGAATTGHGRRKFIDHLVGTWRVLSHWEQPAVVCKAGLFHSVYGTEFFRASHFGKSEEERARVRAFIGTEAEELAYLFCTVERRALHFGPLKNASRVQHGQLRVLEAANIAEQSSMPSGAPSNWGTLVSRLLRWASDEGAVLPASVFDGARSELRTDQEEGARRSYAALLAADDVDDAERAARATAARNPWVAEPHLALASIMIERGDYAGAAASAEHGLVRLVDWGTAWDKRRSWEMWLRAAFALREKASSRASGPILSNHGMVERAATTHANELSNVRGPAR